MSQRVVIFDTSCLLCSRFIQLLVKSDSDNLQYTGLESAFAGTNLPPELIATEDSVIFYENGTIMLRSEAIFAILRYMPWYYRWLRFFRILPKGLLDRIYNWIARNRYGWFGRANECFLPSASQQHKFLA